MLIKITANLKFLAAYAGSGMISYNAKMFPDSGFSSHRGSSLTQDSWIVYLDSLFPNKYTYGTKGAGGKFFPLNVLFF
jgi:hypothetical protein